ncbi:MAG: ATP-binding cassette domain-containing protein [Prevotella sp.]|nr:ATP-binding cassette domain-containing protein [Candidatus Prevotella equi]
MQKITFDNVTPKVFQGQGNLNSEIWQTEAVFEKGRLYLVEAESGKGKSTFCSYILGYRNDYSGNILFDNENTLHYKANKWAEIRSRHVSHLFQELRLFPELTAMENVMIKNQLTSHLDEKTVLSWFERLGIPEKVNQKIGKMSFGQQQRVAMMRALAQPFDILLADEPISHLDDRNSKIMAEIMMEEANKQNACVIVTSIGKHMDMAYDKVFKL